MVSNFYRISHFDIKLQMFKDAIKRICVHMIYDHDLSIDKNRIIS